MVGLMKIIYQKKRSLGEKDQEEHAYPFAGATNVKVRLGVVPIIEGTVTWMDLCCGGTGDTDDEYLARVNWMNGNTLVAQVLNRSHSKLKLIMFDTRTGQGSRVSCSLFGGGIKQIVGRTGNGEVVVCCPALKRSSNLIRLRTKSRLTDEPEIGERSSQNKQKSGTPEKDPDDTGGVGTNGVVHESVIVTGAEVEAKTDDVVSEVSFDSKFTLNPIEFSSDSF